MFGSPNRVESSGRFFELALCSFDGGVENIMNQGGFPAAADPGDACENAQRDANVQMLQIVLVGIDDLDAFFWIFRRNIGTEIFSSPLRYRLVSDLESCSSAG